MMALATLQEHGWELLDAEQRHAEFPSTFELPSAPQRAALKPGDFAKLMFVISTEDAAGNPRRPVERMWVLVRERVTDGYFGVLDNDPGEIAANDEFRSGIELPFQARHVIEVQTGDEASTRMAGDPPFRPWPR